MTPSTTKLLLLCAVLAAVPAHAQIYKWVDAKGVTHYSDKPPDDPRVKPMQPELIDTTVSADDLHRAELQAERDRARVSEILRVQQAEAQLAAMQLARTPSAPVCDAACQQARYSTPYYPYYFGGGRLRPIVTTPPVQPRPTPAAPEPRLGRRFTR